MNKKYIVFTILTIGALIMTPTNHPETAPNKKLAHATFAGGCFWCMEPPFEKLPNVTVIAGYTGGTTENPTYDDYEKNGHIEAIDIAYDPTEIAYEQLLDIFWKQIDPTDTGGQFVDRGPQYASAIFYHTPAQKKAAEKSKAQLAASGIFTKPIVTPIVPAQPFYPAENYHQDYYKNHWLRYKWYRARSGRDRFLKKHWQTSYGQKYTHSQETQVDTQANTQKLSHTNAEKKPATTPFIKPTNKELRALLTPLQFDVTQRDKTEPPFDNTYWDNKKPGIYVDVVSGEPLFSSHDQFKSGTGWPSFTRPLEPDNIVIKEDRGWFRTRMEVRSKQADSHLGHVFDDGPEPTGKRYCINSAALKFIPAQELESSGYEKYKKLFD